MVSSQVVAAVHRVGLTGGIGSGKSTVAGMLAQLGARVIDADAISRNTTAPGGSAIAALRASFGSAMLTADGALDREQMRALVYSNPGAKAQLEGIIHPLVGQAIADQARQAERGGARCIVFDIPLLVESAQWRKALDRILVVDCTEATQVTRVMGRDGLTAADIERIMVAQASRRQRLGAADIVVFNDRVGIDQLARLVREIGLQFGL